MIRFMTIFVLLLPASALNAAEPMGRLFFTPAQRGTLDAGKPLERPKGTPPRVRGPRSLTVNGIVTRSDGASTVWVNGSATDASRRSSRAVSATSSDPVTARVQTSGTSTRLRVGQSLNRATGKITESYESAPQKSIRKARTSSSPDSPNGSMSSVGDPNGIATDTYRGGEPDTR